MRKSVLWAALFAAAIMISGWGCGASEPPPEPESTMEAEAPPDEMAEVIEPPPAEPEVAPEPPPAKKAAPKVAPKKAEPPANPVVVMETSKGTLRIELYPERAPKTVANFLEYVDAGFYDGTVFHRVIPNFMIQGGGMDANMNERDTRAPIENESRNGLANLRGTIAMARTADPHSATAQFFINHVSNHNLNSDQMPGGWGYAVFGKVIDGMNVVDAIAQVPTGNKGGHQNVPNEAVTIRSVRRAS